MNGSGKLVLLRFGKLAGAVRKKTGDKAENSTGVYALKTCGALPWTVAVTVLSTSRDGGGRGLEPRSDIHCACAGPAKAIAETPARKPRRFSITYFLLGRVLQLCT